MSNSRAVSRDVGVVIAAAGSGVRFGKRKALLRLAGRPLLYYSLRAFSAISQVLEIVVAVAEEDLEKARWWIRRWQRSRGGGALKVTGGKIPRIYVVKGGDCRQKSVWLGMEGLSRSSRIILVHDAARPLVRADNIRELIRAIRKQGAAVLGHPATDSVKGAVKNFADQFFITVDAEREQLWVVQTPQGALADLLRLAFRKGRRRKKPCTDEAGLLTAARIPVRLLRGHRSNIKVTFREDLTIAEALLKKFSGRALDRKSAKR